MSGMTKTSSPVEAAQVNYTHCDVPCSQVNGSDHKLLLILS